MKSQDLSDTVKVLKRKSEEVSELLKYLSHPQRLLIFCALADGEKSVGEIEEICGASQSAVSQFLKSMKSANLIEARREGQYVFYSIKDERVLSLMKCLYEVFCA